MGLLVAQRSARLWLAVTLKDGSDRFLGSRGFHRRDQEGLAILTRAARTTNVALSGSETLVKP
jgi:hypothetical protein